MTRATAPPLGDLAARRLGGMVLAASDEFLAPKERLLEPGPPQFRPGADPEVLAALAEGNRAYEERFGHVFLVFASGRGAAELLDELRGRLGNDPGTELRVTAAAQRRITRLRLDKLLRP